jgi:hypothetical protein
MRAGAVCLPLRDKFWILMLALLVLAQATASLVIPRGDALIIVSDWIQSILLLMATAAFLPNTLASRSPSRRTRAFWVLTFSGMLFWLSYQGMWNYFEVFKRAEVPSPFSGDVVLFLHLVPMMAALALLPHLQEDERDARIRMLDFALLLIWWVFLYVYAVIPWQTVHINEAAYLSNFNATSRKNLSCWGRSYCLPTTHKEAGAISMHNCWEPVLFMPQVHMSPTTPSLTRPITAAASTTFP